MEYLVEVNEFDLTTDKEMSQKEVKEYAASANCENLRSYHFTDKKKARKAFESAQGLAKATNKDNNYVVNVVELKEVDKDEESEYHLTINGWYPEIKK